jgi:hypothetical protein
MAQFTPIKLVIIAKRLFQTLTARSESTMGLLHFHNGRLRGLFSIDPPGQEPVRELGCAARMGLAGIWDCVAAQHELKARGGGDAGTSLTTSNAEIGLQPPCALRVPAVRGHLLRWRSSTMFQHRLRRAALHLPTRRSERGIS